MTPDQTPDQTTYLTEEQAARRLGLARITLATWRGRGRGPAHCRFGRAVRYRVDDLDAWARAQRVVPARGA